MKNEPGRRPGTNINNDDIKVTVQADTFQTTSELASWFNVSLNWNNKKTREMECLLLHGLTDVHRGVCVEIYLALIVV